MKNTLHYLVTVMLSRIGSTSLVFLLLISLWGCERTVTVPPPDEPPPNGHIFIDTYPEGMHIFMDEKDRLRKTPDSITWLKTRIYDFTLKHAFFLDTSFQVNAVEGEKESLFIDYRLNPKMLATLEIDSYPQGASIYLNDSLLTTKSPHLITGLLPGYYKVKYKLENHRDTEHKVLLTSSNTTRSFLPMLDITLWRDYNSQNSELKSDNLTCITKDIYQNIRIGSEGWGIYTFDGNRFDFYYNGNSAISNNFINDIIFMPDNTMLIATEQMAIVAPQEPNFGMNEYERWEFWQVGDPETILPDNYVTSVTYETNGKFWFGTKKGLLSAKLDVVEDVYTQEVFTTENSALIDNHISDIKWLNNELWIGTKSSGFAIANQMNEELELLLFNKSNSGLRSDNVNSILPLGERQSYIGTSTNSNHSPGLAYQNGDSWFTEYGDMPDNNVLSIYKDSKGRTWVGTETSIIVFTNWDDKIIYNYENTSLPIIKISGFLEDRNGDILITSLGGGLFRYMK